MSLAWMPAAFASSPTNASLSISPTTTGASSTATNGFTATTAIPSTGSITISSDSTSGSPSASNSEQLPYATTDGSDYTVTCSPSCNTGSTSSNTVTVASSSTANSVTLDLSAPIAAGDAVTVTINGVTNATSPSTVYFNDSTSTDTTPVNTNTVQIGTATAVVPTLTDLEPHTLPSATAAPFTITGQNFFGSTSGGVTTDPPLVCFVTAGNTPGAAPSTYVCPASTGSGSTTTYQATVSFVSGSEIQGALPTTIPAGSFDTVVYNYNPSANSGAGGYTAASAVNSGDKLVTISGLDFVPESGVRVADSRSGDNLPKGSLPAGTTVAIPVTDFANSPGQPDNLPALPGSGVTGLSMNITAVAPAGVGNLQVFPESGACPAASTINTSASNTFPATVNFQPPEDTSNDTLIPTPSGTTNICVLDNGASVPVVMDLTGYTTGSGYEGTTPSSSNRFLDTRYGTGGLLGPLSGGTVYSVSVPSLCTTIVSGTVTPGQSCAGQTIAINVAAVAPTAVGNLRVFPQPSSGPPTSISGIPNTAVVNYIPGTDESSFYIVNTGSTGKLDIYSDTSGKVNVVLDYYGTVDSTHVHALSEPFRVYDSRPGGIASGNFAMVTASPSGSGSNFVPSGAAAVIGSLSDIDPTAVGNLRTYPAGTPVPNAATMPNYPNQIRENLALIALNPSNGAFDIYSDGATTNTTFDATAYIS